MAEEDIKTGDLVDFDEESWSGGDVDLNYFLKRGIAQAQTVLSKVGEKGTMAQSILTYSIVVGQLESLAKAKKYIKEDYDEKIEKFLKSKQYTEAKRDEMKWAMLANKKFHLIVHGIVDEEPVDTPLTL